MAKTADELKDDAEFEKWFGPLLKARAAIVEATGGKVGVSGHMVCPVDGGTLRYSVAACNGHIHAACSNDGCVRWME